MVKSNVHNPGLNAIVTPKFIYHQKLMKKIKKINKETQKNSFKGNIIQKERAISKKATSHPGPFAARGHSLPWDQSPSLAKEILNQLCLSKSPSNLFLFFSIFVVYFFFFLYIFTSFFSLSFFYVFLSRNFHLFFFHASEYFLIKWLPPGRDWQHSSEA